MLRFLISKPRSVRSFHSSYIAWAKTPFKLADIGEGISEVELIQWFVKPGDKVEEFSKICEVQSDKAAVEITSRYEGTIMKLHHEVGAIAKVGSVLVDIETQNEAESTDTEDALKPAVEKPKEVSVNDKPGKVQESLTSKKVLSFATPAVRRIAKENSINIVEVQGSGPKGRVLKGDILGHIQNGNNKTSRNDHFNKNLLVQRLSK